MKQDQNWLAEMESRRRDDEPSPGQEMADLMRRTDEVLKGLSPKDGAKLRELSAGWRGMRSPAAMRPTLMMASGNCSLPPRRGPPGGRKTCA